jgi:hypothetical protein
VHAQPLRQHPRDLLNLGPQLLANSRRLRYSLLSHRVSFLAFVLGDTNALFGKTGRPLGGICPSLCRVDLCKRLAVRVLNLGGGGLQVTGRPNICQEAIKESAQLLDLCW